MMVVGVTGVIGSGKSTVSRMISDLGYPVIDLDSIAQRILETEEVISAIKEAFGEEVVIEGKIERKRLAEKVFKDESALRKLESIIHPLVLVKMREKIEKLKQDGKKVIFVDGPLIFEAGIQGMFDRVVVVYAEESQIIKRVKRRGLEKEELLLRLKRQLPLEAKVKMADHVIVNTGSKEKLRVEVEKLIKKIREWEEK